MNKVCYIDVETTGLDAVKQDIIQLAMLIEIDGVIVKKVEFKCQPITWNNIQDGALKVHGYTLADLKEFPDVRLTFSQVLDLLDTYVNKFDKNDKFVFAGYNCPFDSRFVREWFAKLGNPYFGSYFDYKEYDIFPLFKAYTQACGITLPNHKLVTAAEHFGIPLQAHDAMSDIMATYQIGKKIEEILRAGNEKLQAIDVDF
jgi:DNA polymerase III epsilon subunit-like protein